MVLLGVADLKLAQQENFKPIKGYEMFPAFLDGWTCHSLGDLTIVELEEPIQSFNPWTLMPICLPDPLAEPGTELYIAGWGANRTFPITTEKGQKV